MSAPGRPQGSCGSAQHDGAAVAPPGRRLLSAHDRVRAEHRRSERWQDLRAAMGMLALALLVLGWLPLA